MVNVPLASACGGERAPPARLYRLDHLRTPQRLAFDLATVRSARIAMMRFRVHGGGQRGIAITADASRGPLDVYDILASWFNRMRVAPEAIDLREVVFVINLVATDPEPLPVDFAITSDGRSTLGNLAEPTRRICADLLVRWGITDR